MVPQNRRKYAFVTIGASASFKLLIEEVLSEAFIAKLKSLRFTHLTIQCGPDYDYFLSVEPESESDPDDPDELLITGFPYHDDIRRYMELTSSSHVNPTLKRERGLIITHAGSGSILEALDFDSVLIAVPNPTLMDNHQLEIAEEMDSQGHLIQGKIGSLVDIINEDIFTAPKKQWPPDPDPESEWPGGLWDVISALMPER
ncbi:UDP-N-acetylglucosamine transferase subunit alg13 [Daldinia childiae]|uniref:UDP-N-acetylglucosamine transferase subunit alg13 n=1 Tax=Daldinia childiae TaxID=326645 RepID=UPI0014463414|nr:UDP-N-acetylglucosamine transferase subunit alg13 [Daldinia childiae]KAF3058666.1 UDP-N-acetylglucosamine transferase subunit alg13 [Daldinia childiae]